MAWTTPRTWVTSELVTASLMNTHLRDNLNALRVNPENSCAVYHSTTQMISGGSTDVILFDSESYDTASMHSTSSNTSRVTVPTGGDGYYVCVGLVNRVSGSGNFQLELRVDGSSTSKVVTSSNEADFLYVHGRIDLDAGQYVELRGSAISNSVTTGSTSSASSNWFEVYGPEPAA